MLDQILDVAEKNIRMKGYHAVSFRDLADELGVKSASVHYYFRRKENLGQSLISRYADDFFGGLEARVPMNAAPKQRVAAICYAYYDALDKSDTLCLCGILGAESYGLPEVMQKDVSGFFNKNIDWLEAALMAHPGSINPRQKATAIIASLQGGMMLASNLGDKTVFKTIIKDILDGLHD